ncbi:MAG: hypothetical protein GKS05_12005 [Nitrospirales bacterium]|nr:hypothetical protein [Nitrospirales bacterium]
MANPEHLEILMQGAVVWNAWRKKYLGTKDYFFGVDLSWADLKGADLVGANLSRTNLVGANLLGADLRRANLSGANLSKVQYLRQAHLNEASFRDGPPKNLPKGLTPPLVSVRDTIDCAR